MSDNSVLGGRFPKTYFNRNQAPAAVYRKHKLEKKQAHQQQIQEVEHSAGGTAAIVCCMLHK